MIELLRLEDSLNTVVARLKKSFSLKIWQMLIATLCWVGIALSATESAPNVTPTFKRYCFQCHGKTTAMGGVNLDLLSSQSSVGTGFKHWEKVALALEQKRMPPEKMPQPTDAERLQAVNWIRTELKSYAKKHDGDPGRVTVRRLTSGEYAYTIQDLTGIDLDAGISTASDSVGGEGFTNFGDVQFMQDANVERYLEAAKLIANHAVIGSGPIQFFNDPGKTGFELSAIQRIKDIYATSGFRTVSGEGGRPFGLEKYTKAFYATWRYKHRAALGEANKSLKDMAASEGIAAIFAQHMWTVLNKPALGYPSSEVVARWRKLPAPGPNAKATSATVLTQCEAIQKYLVTWPSWLFARGDVAAGGAGDESPLQFNDTSLKVEASHHFRFNAGGGRGAPRTRVPATGPIKVYLNIAAVNALPNKDAIVIWHNPTVSIRQAAARPPATATPATPQTGGVQPAATQSLNPRNFPPAGPKLLLREVVSAETAKTLNFGVSSDGTPIGPDDFASASSVVFEVPVPAGSFGLEFQVDAQLGGDHSQVFRIVLSDREDGGSRGIPTRTLLGDPTSEGYRTFKSGVMELATILPPNSHGEPTPADKDPVPQPFDSTFNVPEHDEFVLKVKYVREDHYVVENLLDEATRTRLNQAWNDVYASFDYHDNYLRLLAQHFKLDLKGKHIGDLDKAQIDAMPAEIAKYVTPLFTAYKQAHAAQLAARPGHIDDAIRFASRAWRRPLTAAETQSLRGFYKTALASEQDHTKAIRALLARILVSPAFLYRVELTADAAALKPFTNWELASRLSYFLWSSIPDDELRRASAAGELNNPQKLHQQVKRMLADAKARRLSTEFFGQWLGFYRFDQSRSVDTARFPEFTDEVKGAMYDEAVSFFEHVIRKDRPIGDILSADYTFLNKALAKHYGVKNEIKSTDKVELVNGANAFQRGGLLRLGAVLTATSAPLRTSPVKRGDWVLRRVIGTPVPPPPADAGTIPADDKLFGGLSVKDKLEAHKRNPTCANCHVRIDPLGFPLEHYDPVGRWRAQYADGKPIHDSGVLSDKTEIAGIDGLLKYLHTQEKQVLRTMSTKLVGFALGRTVQASDELLLERMSEGGAATSFSKLISEIAASKQFRNYLGDEKTPPAIAKAVKNLEKPRMEIVTR